MPSTPGLSRAAPLAEVDVQPRLPTDDDALPAWLTCSRVYAVVLVNDSGGIVFTNEIFASLLGYKSAAELIGRDLRQCCLSNDTDWAQFQNEDAHQFEFRHAQGTSVLLSGEVRRCLDSTDGMLYQCLLHRPGDAADNGQLLEHAARMEAVAGLSSGVAHDFNNLLTVLVGNLYLLGEELRDNESAFARIKAARDTALRGSELTRQLLNYARADDTDDVEINPVAVVRKLQPLLEKLVGSRIELRIDAAVNGLTVRASRAQLESAIVNLVINARDAIDGQGTIIVGVREPVADSAEQNHLVVSVSDDGPGMSEVLQQRVFEPFFTTKGEGRGTGLGLSMVRWFAESASGAVAIESEPGNGTTVSMLLPMAGSQAGDTTCSRTLPLSVLPSGNEHIALYIDDAEVRAMTQQTLTVLGYDVRHVGSGEIPRERADMERFDLVIIDADEFGDVVSLVGELQRKGSVRVLALSARTLPALDNELQLRKPFSLIELACSVRAILDGETVSG
jgi:signal transduction histidine kinase